MIRVNLAGLNNRKNKYNGGRYSPPPLEYDGISGGVGSKGKIGTLLGVNKLRG